MTRGSVLTVRQDVELVTETCYSCSILFAMPEDYREARLRNHSLTFYCPNGHSQKYVGETEAEKYKRLYQASERRAGENYDRAERAERSRTALRGVVTRQRNRAVAGACPFGCRRHFADLERHVAAKHPGQKLEGENPDA